MNNFRVLTAFDPRLLLAALQMEPSAWDLFTGRQDYAGSAHSDSKAIVLRGPLNLEDPVSWFQCQLSRDYSNVPEVIQQAARPLVDLVWANSYNPIYLGRVMITKLPPGGGISAHVDEGLYADAHTRFHLPLQSDPGSEFHCGDEKFEMVDGYAYWFNHKARHFVVNNSKRDRIHLIVDVVEDR